MDASKQQKEKLKRQVAIAATETEKGNWRIAKLRWQEIAQEYGSNSPAKVWVSLSRSARRAGDLNLARESAMSGLKYFAEEKELYKELAIAATATGSWDIAAKSWQRTTKLFKDSTTSKMRTELYRANAELAMQNRRWKQALAAWQRVLLEIPSDSGSQLKLQARFYESILSRLVNLRAYRRQIRHYIKSKQSRKIAIVTAVSQAYDQLKPPQIVDPRFDYYCYTDDSSIQGIGIYKIRPLPHPELDPARSIRYVKTHPHILFPEYEVAVWIDTAVMIVGDIYPLVNKFITSKMAVGSGVHPLRKNIYEEFETNIKLKKEDPVIMKKQIDYYKKQGFEHSDLSENTLLMFNLKHPKLAPTLETWWEQIMKFSKRDQLSFNFALAKNDTAWFRLTKPPTDIRNHPDFVWTPHSVNEPALIELTRALSDY